MPSRELSRRIRMACSTVDGSGRTSRLSSRSPLRALGKVSTSICGRSHRHEARAGRRVEIRGESKEEALLMVVVGRKEQRKRASGEDRLGGAEGSQ